MPAKYAIDCAALCGRTVDHAILPAEQYTQYYYYTAAQQLYYEEADHVNSSEPNGLHFLVAAVRRQQTFMSKMLVRRATFDTPDYMRLCVRQYARFLGLMQ